MPSRPLAAAFVLLTALTGFARAQEPNLGGFAGQWVGKVTVETMGPTDFPNTVREAGLTLTPDPAGDFNLEWSTVRRDSGDRSDPDETVQDTEVKFVKAGSVTRWTAAPTGEGMQWYARLEGFTLTVTGFGLLPDGQAELQTYRRTIEGDEMALTYTRVVDGDLKRRASGALTRFAQ
jgi:hypothetical protein